jgi:hypothetical protein
VKSLSLLLLLALAFPGKPPVPETEAEPLPYAAAHALIREGQALLKEGDLVFRMNEDFTSQFIRQFNRKDKSFSHVGIILFENGRPFVYHMGTENNPQGLMQKDSLAAFCNPRHNRAYGIYRYALNPGELKTLKKSVLSWKESGVRFDSSFNLNSKDLMYCSEMVARGLGLATQGRIRIETTAPTALEARLFSVHLSTPYELAKKMKIIAIDNLYTNPACREVKRYEFVLYWEEGH